MNVLLVGATGYVGSSIAKALKAAGHTVTGTARTDDAEKKLRDSGITPVRADITDPESLKKAAAKADGAIYAVQYNGNDGEAVESAALRAIGEGLSANKPFIFTSGAWVYGSTGDRVADEQSPNNPTPVVAHRPRLEQIVLDARARGVSPVIIRPGDVYGNGGGIPAMWVQAARESGAARFVGDGSSHWPVVHIDDLAQLYVLALEKAAAGSIYNAADGSSFTVREMAEAASRGAGADGKVQAWPLEEARKALGPFADALALDSRIDSSKAREELGWRTRSTTILDDLVSGSYAKRAT